MRSFPQIIAMMLLAGCIVRPEGKESPVALPAAYPHKAGAQSRMPGEQWWLAFANAELNHVVGLARQGSYDVAAALTRIEQARTRIRIANSALRPQVSAQAGWRQSGRLGEEETPDATVSMGVPMSYELDLWGKLRAERSAARQLLRADVYDQQAVLLTVTADTVSAWFQAVAAKQRRMIAVRNLENAERVLQLITVRRRAGAATELEMAQQRGVVAAQQTALAVIAARIEETELALGLLLGRAASMKVRTASLSAVRPVGQEVGVPSRLLVSRPDLARAEAALVAANADITAARAALLPGVTLSSSLDSSSIANALVFQQPLYQLASGLTFPIFDRGRLTAARDASVARREELLANFRKAIVTAFGEVENALIAQQGLLKQQESQSRQLAEAKRAFGLAESRYRAGAETMLTLLQTQASLYGAEDANIQLQLERFISSVALFKAVGGGWTRQ